jgi:hypothetical protein
MKAKVKTTPNKKPISAKPSKGGYAGAKGPKGKPKATGKKPSIKARKSKISEAVKKVKF